MVRITRRRMTTAAIAGVSLGLTACDPPKPPENPDPLVIDDQSRLNATRVSRHIRVRGGPGADARARLDNAIRAGLSQARAAGLPMCAGGARHSMGGQSLPPANGVAVSVTAPDCVIDAAAGSYTVDAAARWRDVIASLDPHGYSPAVMQSNNDFAVGGAVSVNAHGWAVPHGPVGSTVRRFRLMLASGEIVSCSPFENAELFHACVGGYGLMGVLLDIELAFERNLMLAPSQSVMPSGDFAARFAKAVHEPGVRLAYGRLSVARGAFLSEALLGTYRVAKAQPTPLPAVDGASWMDRPGRFLFRGQSGSDLGKRLRWWTEKRMGESQSAPSTRNSVLNSPVQSFAGFDFKRTDILHEYFVPPEAMETFLRDCRAIIPRSDQDLLNVTLRWVEADPHSLLSFAPQPRIALVMLFSQAMTAAAEADMRALTQRLIDAALAAGGSFYLPYRLHARPDQVRAAYPRLAQFIALKRRWDPQLTFRNQMWDRYFAE
jgi:FAD/FMN-containing dehydrogenase